MKFKQWLSESMKNSERVWQTLEERAKNGRLSSSDLCVWADSLVEENQQELSEMVRQMCEHEIFPMTRRGSLYVWANNFYAPPAHTSPMQYRSKSGYLQTPWMLPENIITEIAAQPGARPEALTTRIIDVSFKTLKEAIFAFVNAVKGTDFFSSYMPGKRKEHKLSDIKHAFGELHDNVKYFQLILNGKSQQLQSINDKMTLNELVSSVEDYLNRVNANLKYISLYNKDDNFKSEIQNNLETFKSLQSIFDKIEEMELADKNRYIKEDIISINSMLRKLSIK